MRLPPGPSPFPPSHSVTTSACRCRTPAPSIATKHCIARINGVDRRGPIRRHDADRIAELSLHRIEAIAPLIAAAEGATDFSMIRLVERQQDRQRTPRFWHASRTRRSPPRQPGRREVAGAGPRRSSAPSIASSRRPPWRVESAAAGDRRIHPVSAEQQDLARLPAVFGLPQPANRPIENGDARRDRLRAKTEILEKLQLGSGRVQREPVALVLRNRLLVGVRHCLRRADEHLKICEGRVRPVILFGRARPPRHSAPRRPSDRYRCRSACPASDDERDASESRVDPGIVMTRIGTEAMGVAMDRRASSASSWLRRRASGLASFPTAASRPRPCVLVHATKQRPYFRIGRVLHQRRTVMLTSPVKRVTWLPGQGQALQAHALLSQPFDVLPLDLEPLFQVFERELEALGLAQRLTRVDPRVGAEGGDRPSSASTSTSPIRPALRASPRLFSHLSCFSQNSRTSPMRRDFQSGSWRFGMG